MGYECTKRIRLMELGAEKRTAIIAITGDPPRGHSCCCELRLGMMISLSKPFESGVRAGVLLRHVTMRISEYESGQNHATRGRKSKKSATSNLILLFCFFEKNNAPTPCLTDETQWQLRGPDSPQPAPRFCACWCLAPERLLFCFLEMNQWAVDIAVLGRKRSPLFFVPA